MVFAVIRIGSFVGEGMAVGITVIHISTGKTIVIGRNGVSHVFIVRPGYHCSCFYRKAGGAKLHARNTDAIACSSVVIIRIVVIVIIIPVATTAAFATRQEQQATA